MMGMMEGILQHLIDKYQQDKVLFIKDKENETFSISINFSVNLFL